MYPGKLAAAVLIAAVAAGCASTRQSTEIERSGFLGDYTLLERGGEGEAAFRYVNTSADWPGYKNIMLDPITIWRNEDTAAIPAEDLQRLADNLYSLLYQELEKDYTMVSRPQESTLRFQIAFTGADPSNATLDVVSTVIPIGLVVSSATEFVTGEPSFGGGATVEIKVTDAISGEIMGAALDRRVGGKDLGGAFDSWDDVNSAFVFWSQLTRFRLCKLRDDAGCVEPG